MRKIKFRVWDKKKKEMKTCCPNYLVGGDGTLHWQFGLQEPWPLIAREHEVMQYTGLKDKNGKEIYEGDIVSGGFGIPPVGVRSVVEYDGSAFIVRTEKHNPKQATLKTAIECLDIEVIGNIHENPELAEAQGDDAPRTGPFMGLSRDGR